MRRMLLLALFLVACGESPPPPPAAAVPIVPPGPAEPARLRGIVSDEAGRPLPGVAVRAVLPYGGGHRARNEGLVGETEPDGTFALDITGAFDPPIDPPVLLVASKDGYVSFRGTIQAYRRGTGTSVEFRLFRAATVTGRVVDDAGAAVAGALVFALPPGVPGAERADALPSTRTGADGGFSITGLPPGECDLGVSADGYRPLVAGPVALRAGETPGAGVLILTRGAEIVGTVKTPEGEPVKDVIVRAFRDPACKNYVLFGRSSVEKAGGLTTTDDKGRFRIPGLAPGAYAVEAETPGYRVVDAARQDVRPAGEPLAFVLAPDCWLELAVVDARTGAPVDRYDLLVTPADGSGITRWEEVRGAGAHRVPVNRAEELRIEVSAEGYEVLVRPVVAADPGATPLTIPLAAR